jgi:hypothetical protein
MEHLRLKPPSAEEREELRSRIRSYVKDNEKGE